MLAEFLEWWGGQLRTLVPVRLAGSPGSQDALIADASVPGVLAFARRRRGVEQRVVQLRQETDAAVAPGLRAALAGRPRGEPVRLRIAPSLVLERAVNLPLAAERDLARVLGYEMERLTPFAAAELVWDATVQLRDRPRARLGLRLTMVPLAAIAPVAALLRGHGGAPDAVEAMLPDGMRVLRLARQDGAGRRGAARALAAAAGVLALLVLASPFIRQSVALSDLQDGLARIAPRMAQVEGLRRRIAGAGAGGDAVAAETRRLGDTLAALAAITEIMPDDSYLTEFTMRERKITLSGLGASAPKLISLLSADPRIRNPAFTAPVTRSETNHNDVFSIRAELAP